jgi:hypothetical protein
LRLGRTTGASGEAVAELAPQGFEALDPAGQLQQAVTLQRHRHHVGAKRDVGIGGALGKPRKPPPPRVLEITVSR